MFKFIIDVREWHNTTNKLQYIFKSLYSLVTEIYITLSDSETGFDVVCSVGGSGRGGGTVAAEAAAAAEAI